jgi:tetratricopeptide (TPR) repeat protein
MPPARTTSSRVRTRDALRILAGVSTLLAALSAVAQPPDANPATIAVEVALTDEQRSLLGRAEALIQAGDGAQAYALLAPHEAELAGNALYDYWLGVAALDSGMRGEAVFSLRRVLAVAPGFSGAALELARAYFESGNPELARPLFEQLLNEQPPEPVREAIAEYLNAIDRGVARGPSQLTAFVDGALGHDSNANGSTDAQRFLGFTLDPRNVEADSAFAEVGAGLDWLRVRGSRLAWVGRLRGGQRHNPDASFIDSTLLSGLAGFAWQRRGTYGNAAFETYSSALDGDPNETYTGLRMMAGGALAGSAWHLVGDLRVGALRFDADLDVLEVDRTIAGLALVRRFDRGRSVTLQAIAGGDAERQESSPFGNSKSGARIAVDFPVDDDLGVVASWGTLDSDYDGAFFGAARKDTQSSLVVEVTWRDAGVRGLDLGPRVRVIDNESTVALYAYDRTEIGLTFRYSPRK